MLCELIPSLLLFHSEQSVEDCDVLHIIALKPFLSLRPAKPTESFLLSPARRPKRKKTAIRQMQDTAVHPWDVHHCAPTQTRGLQFLMSPSARAQVTESLSEP